MNNLKLIVSKKWDYSVFECKSKYVIGVPFFHSFVDGRAFYWLLSADIEIGLKNLSVLANEIRNNPEKYSDRLVEDPNELTWTREEVEWID